MAILAVGLLAAGVGTMVFVRNALVTYQDDGLVARASSNLAAGLLDIEVDDDGEVKISLTDEGSATDYFVAVYDPEGNLLGTVPTQGGPEFPETFKLEETISRGTTPFTLENDKGAVYHASAGVLDLQVGSLYTQVLALPLAPIDRIVATFFGIFSILALVTMVGGALLTRWLVTQTFRPLGQVESTAMAISAGDFSQRLTVGDPRTEVGRLTAAINTMLNRVDASLSQRDASVRQMRRFIGDASHELRTPLVTVRGYAELYRIGAITGDEDTAQAMERIEKEAVRMGAMVEDLLALARLDERSAVSISPIDLRPIARDAAMDIRVSSPQRVITVIDETAATLPPIELPPAPPSPGDAGSGRRTGAPAPTTTTLAGATMSLLRRIPRPVPATRATEGDDAPPVTPVDLSSPTLGAAIALPPIVLGEENRVRQVVANLLGNARRFTADDSPIEITVGTDAGRVTEFAPMGMGWIQVADHGEGIPEQIRSHIFERFWRADTSRTRDTGGTGLGLSIVASIVEALHGVVAVDETPGGGASFRVYLPLAREATLYLDTQPLPRIPEMPSL